MKDHDCKNCARLSVCSKVSYLLIVSKHKNEAEEIAGILDKRRYLIVDIVSDTEKATEVCKNHRVDSVYINKDSSNYLQTVFPNLIYFHSLEQALAFKQKKR